MSEYAYDPNNSPIKRDASIDKNPPGVAAYPCAVAPVGIRTEPHIYDAHRRSTSEKYDGQPKQRNLLIESFEWMTPEFQTADSGKDSIRIKGVAMKPSVSLNNKKYITDELKRSARTFISKPVDVNHNGKPVGTVIWCEYSDKSDALEYLADIKKQPYVDMLRNKSTQIRGVSITAEFLHNVCAICQRSGVEKRFTSEAEFNDHMVKEHFIHNAPKEVHGILGQGISLVLAPEVCGSRDTTIELLETKQDGLTRLYETVLKEHSKADETLILNGVPIATALNPKPTDLVGAPLNSTTQATKDVYPKKSECNVKSPQQQLTEAQQYLETHSDPKVQESFTICYRAMVVTAKDKAGITETQTKLSETVNENTTLKETVKTQTQTITELNATVTTLKEKTAALTETTTSERDSLKEMVHNQNERILSLEEQAVSLNKEVAKRDGLVEANRKLIVENDNLRDRLKPHFKAHTLKSPENEANTPIEYAVDPNKRR
jgi:hypothetical protein